MSTTEILVVIGGLGLGYWVVSRLFDDLYRGDRQAPTPEKDADQNAGASGKPAVSDKSPPSPPSAPSP